MSVFDTIRIAASGLTAQRLRMDVASANIANADSTRTGGGGPYRPESVVFAPQDVSPSAGAPGVSAISILTPNSAPVRVYDPGHPDADAQGFVFYPDIDIAAQMTDLMGAARSYSLNSTVAQAAKQQALDALELGRG
jgi:flagellar basal-body rod protein FlgC